MVAVGLAGGCLAMIGYLQLARRAELSAELSQPLSQTQYFEAEDREAATLSLYQRLPTFGFDNLMANFTFLKFLQYFGDGPARQRTGYRLSPEYFEIIIKRDPHFLQTYQFLSPAVSLYAGAPRQTVKLIQTGLKSISPEQFPDAYLVWVYKGTDELLFLGDNDAARRSFETAAAWAQRNGDPESQRLGAISARTAAFLTKNPDSRSAQASAWLMVYANSVDEGTRQRAIRNIEQLGGKLSYTPGGRLQFQLPDQD